MAVCTCRDRQLLAEAAMQAFQANAQPFWAGKKQAQAFVVASSRAKFRKKLQAWQCWAERRCLLRDNLRVVSIVCRRTMLAAGAAVPVTCANLCWCYLCFLLQLTGYEAFLFHVSHVSTFAGAARASLSSLHQLHKTPELHASMMNIMSFLASACESSSNKEGLFDLS